MNKRNRMLTESVEFKTRTYHGRFGSGRTAGRQSGVGGNLALTELVAQKTRVARSFQGIEETTLERLSRSTTSEILCKPNAGTKSAVDSRFMRGLSPGREALFFPGC